LEAVTVCLSAEKSSDLNGLWIGGYGAVTLTFTEWAAPLVPVTDTV